MTQPSPAWFDTQYNNRARVPEHPQILEGWASASALTREKSVCDLDVPYGSGAGETLDIFRTTRADAPVLVYIHGGYWRALDKRDQSFVAASFTDAGALVVVPNYALCPAVSVEHITLQMVRAVAWVYRNAARYGGNPKHIVVAGHSAGGHLAAMMLSCDWPAFAPDLPPRVVKAALSISGVFDLEPLRHAPFLAPDLKLTPASVRKLSPAGFPSPAGMLYAVVGAEESEEFIRQNELIRQAWGAATVPVCETVPGTHHMNVLRELADPGARVHRLGLELLGLADRGE
jgi:arylformamidase